MSPQGRDRPSGGALPSYGQPSLGRRVPSLSIAPELVSRLRLTPEEPHSLVKRLVIQASRSTPLLGKARSAGRARGLHPPEAAPSAGEWDNPGTPRSAFPAGARRREAGTCRTRSRPLRCPQQVKSSELSLASRASRMASSAIASASPSSSPQVLISGNSRQVTRNETRSSGAR